MFLKTLIFLTGYMFSQPELYFIEPTNNSVLSNNVEIKFGLKGFGVAPAGYNAVNTGHHHLLVNVDLPKDLTLPIPADDNHLHFGLGQTEAIIELPPGTHSLRLLLGNYLHIPHSEPIYSEEIFITVE